MKRVRLRLAFAVAVFLTGCASIIGVPDLTLEVRDGGTEGGTLVDGQVLADTGADAFFHTDSAPGDAGSDGNVVGVDAATCDLGKTVDDPLNCGACGHMCLDDAGCASSTCGAPLLQTIPHADLLFMTERGDYLYAVAGYYSDDADEGVWRIHKQTGAKTLYAALPDPDKTLIVGDTLWISTYESTGGLYRCHLDDTKTSCAVELVTTGSYPAGLVLSGTKIYYSDYTSHDLRTFDTAVQIDAGADAAPAIATVGNAAEVSLLYDLWADPNGLFFLNENFDTGTAYKLNAAATSATGIGTPYVNETVPVFHGRIVGTPSSVYWTVSDEFDGTGGTMQRFNRSDNTSCELGSKTTMPSQRSRPQGIFLDAKHVFWTNKGDWGPAYDNGSIVMCDVDTCCTQATFIWKGRDVPYALTGDATHLYWSNQVTGEIHKVTKP